MTSPEPVPAVDAEVEARAAFEKHYRLGFDLTRNEEWGIRYVHDGIEAMWKGWRECWFARLTASQAEAAALRVERDEAYRMRDDAERENAKLGGQRLLLDKRIQCQRKALRDNWEIVEERRKWLGSDAARRYALRYRNRALAAETEAAALKQERDAFKLALVALKQRVVALEGALWRSMDTAPKDGKHCILAIEESPFIYSVQGAYHDGQWNCVHRDNVTPLAWMPNVRLPDEFTRARNLGGKP